MAGAGLWKADWLLESFFGASTWGFWAALGAVLLVAYLLLAARGFLAVEGGRRKPAPDSSESRRMLGLALHGQGQLDQAFDQFRHCPLDPGLMENLYHLALDYERARRFDRAEAVFRHMAAYDLNFRDLPRRLARAGQQAKAPDAASGPAADAAIPAEEPLEKLGRYRLERVLGKGAMGLVYLGRDPERNRLAAIKTLALSREFDPETLAEVRERFFREAETAARLQHPHIVALYEAGEENGLAYIAMEFLAGGDLVPHTRPGHLLPLPTVLSIAARVAEALDYAHRNRVVHRDVKPANILYEPRSGQVKVTDFGIARLTDASRTRAGTVLGTPSYMSPEQLAGRQVDGRADLYSLGVTLYQLCCGRLPFVGKSLAQLMSRIVNEPAADILTVTPDLPPALAAAIAKAMSKDPARRHACGAALAADLQACLAGLGTPSAAGGSLS